MHENMTRFLENEQIKVLFLCWWGVTLSWGFSVWSLHDLPVAQYKDMCTRQTGNLGMKKQPGCFLLCGPATPWPGCHGCKPSLARRELGWVPSPAHRPGEAATDLEIDHTSPTVLLCLHTLSTRLVDIMLRLLCLATGWQHVHTPSTELGDVQLCHEEHIPMM